MLIRSQNKMNLTNMNNVCNLQISERSKKTTEPNIYQIDCNFIDTALMIIGEYQSKEKAIKVLDFIENCYYENMYSKFMTAENETFKSCIFQMPLDEEVILRDDVIAINM